MAEVRRSDYYTVEEVAEIMGSDPESVRRWIRSGELKAWMASRGPGGGYRVDHEKLARFVKGRYPYLALDVSE